MYTRMGDIIEARMRLASKKAVQAWETSSTEGHQSEQRVLQRVHSGHALQRMLGRGFHLAICIIDGVPCISWIIKLDKAKAS